MIVDDQGLYVVSNTAYFNRLEAVEKALSSEQKITFHWNDLFWASQDWTIPPAESLPDLYAQRVKDLREEYDYLILCYSGGADSWNILNTFDRTNTHLDEIASYHDIGFTDDKHSLLSEEITTIAQHDVKAYQQRHPMTQYTLIDSKDVLLPYYKDTSIEKAMEGYFSCTTTFSHPLRRGYYFYITKRYRDLAESGKRVGIIWGHDKPSIRLHNKRYYHSFHDNHIFTTRNKIFYPDFPADNILFYWDKESAKILIKQCHDVIKFLDSKLFNVNVVTAEVAKWGIKTKHGGLVPLYIIDKVLYPGWEPKPGLCKKFTGTVFWQDWDFWLKSKLLEDATSKWVTINQKGYEAFQKLDEAVPPFSTKPYFLN
jgi:hypothetical protein